MDWMSISEMTDEEFEVFKFTVDSNDLENVRNFRELTKPNRDIHQTYLEIFSIQEPEIILPLFLSFPKSKLEPLILSIDIAQTLAILNQVFENEPADN